MVWGMNRRQPVGGVDGRGVVNAFIVLVWFRVNRPTAVSVEIIDGGGLENS